MRLVYVMDPMCAWCYGFQPQLEAFLNMHPLAEVEWIMGGLAPDTHTPMEENLKEAISSYWYQIEKTAQVTFNHDFWKQNTPYRSTYPACRAVIAAERLKTKSTSAMVKAIQSAYYVEAKNPSLKETLMACAKSIGLEESRFLEVFESKETEQQLQKDLTLTYQMQVRAFPALFYIDDRDHAFPLTRSYTQTATLEQRYDDIKKNHSPQA